MLLNGNASLGTHNLSIFLTFFFSAIKMHVTLQTKYGAGDWIVLMAQMSLEYHPLKATGASDGNA